MRALGLDYNRRQGVILKAAIYILAALLLVSAGLNVWSGYKRGQAESDADLWFLVACQADTENKRLSKALNNRQAMEGFMQMQTNAYLAVIDAFNKVAPDMPLGNVPGDPELQRLCVLYYRVNGEPWDGNAEKLKSWGRERYDTEIPDSPESPVEMPAVSFE